MVVGHHELEEIVVCAMRERLVCQIVGVTHRLHEAAIPDDSVPGVRILQSSSVALREEIRVALQQEQELPATIADKRSANVRQQPQRFLAGARLVIVEARRLACDHVSVQDREIVADHEVEWSLVVDERFNTTPENVERLVPGPVEHGVGTFLEHRRNQTPGRVHVAHVDVKEQQLHRWRIQVFRATTVIPASSTASRSTVRPASAHHCRTSSGD